MDRAKVSLAEKVTSAMQDRFTKVKGNKLELVHYHISESFLVDIKLQVNRLLYLDLTDNGLKDHLAAELFRQIAQSRSLKYLTYE